MRPLWLTLALATVLTNCATARTPFSPVPPAQEVVLGRSIVPLNGPWKFSIGDNPAWASPDFDDSHWETVDLTPDPAKLSATGSLPGWAALGHPDHTSGYGWYRIHLHIAAEPGEKLPPHLSILGPMDVDDAYELYLNGRRIGTFGAFPPSGGDPLSYSTQPKTFAFETALLKSPVGQPDNPNAGRPASGVAVPRSTVDLAPVQEQLLAFRVWEFQSSNWVDHDSNSGGIHRAPLLGDAGFIAARAQSLWLKLLLKYVPNVLEALLFLAMSLLAGTLMYFDRTDRVYLFLAAYSFYTALQIVMIMLPSVSELLSFQTMVGLNDCLARPLNRGGGVVLWWLWFRPGRSSRWPWEPWAILALTVLYSMGNAFDGEDSFTFLPVVSPAVGAAFHLVATGVRFGFSLLSLWIIARGIRKEGREGWLVLPVLAFTTIDSFVAELSFLHLPTRWTVLGVEFNLDSFQAVAFVLTLSLLLLRRLQLSLLRQRALALDVRQAQEVQHVLLPEEPPQIPGMRIECEYRPARQVGGDFFQVLAHPENGSVLIVVGDVTGKGLQAGMSVALLVGAIRNQAESCFDPLLMLETLNRRLHGRGSTYATAQALLITTDGQATLANAGHLPPYLNGKELPMEGALPLGMLSETDFPVIHFELAANDRLVLMSDGVPEAQDGRNQLFGFERIEALLVKAATAAELASAAQAFGADRTQSGNLDAGQADDILVLSVLKLALAA